jgi:hypothetical protein
MPKVSVGLSTISLGGVSLTAYVLAVLAFVNGARDEATITTAAIGTVALVSMAAGRFWQAVSKEKARATVAQAQAVAATAELTRGGVAALSSGQEGEFEREPADTGRDLHENGLT